MIGAINGVALGGGLELALNLDMNVAGQTAVFGYPEVKRGVSIQAGGLQRFVRLVGHQKGKCKWNAHGMGRPVGLTHAPSG